MNGLTGQGSRRALRRLLCAGLLALLLAGLAFANDLDGDTDVDIDDIQLILAALGSAAAPGDPLDLDGDGLVTVLDARKAVLKCTRVLCSTGNNTPTISNQTLTVDENSPNGTPVGTVVASDPDVGQTLSFAITAGNTNGAFAIAAATGAVTVANIGELDFETTPSFSLTVEVTDDGTPNLSAAATVTVDLNDLVENLPPSITSSATASVPENTTAVIDVQATDPEGDTEGAGLTYGLTGGVDQGQFSIVPNTGVLTFNVAPDFESPSDNDGDNVYEVQVTVTDSGGVTDVQDLMVTVTGVGKPPTILNGTSVSVTENQAAVIDVQSSDPDGETEGGGGLTYGVTGGADQLLFSIDPNSGVLGFNTAPDFENPGDVGGDNVHDVQVTVTDGSLLTDVLNLAVTVTDLNEAPIFTGGGNVSYSGGVVPQTETGWATGISDGDDGTQVLTFNVTGNTAPGLFDAGPAVDATSGDLTYTPASGASGSATITLELMDDGGMAGGGIDTSAPVMFTLSVTALNQEPSFTAGGDQTVLEDAGAQTVPGWATAIDDGDGGSQVLSFNVSNNNNPLFSAQPAVDAAGTLTYTPAADASGSALVTVELMDDGGIAGGGDDTSPQQTFNINVTTVNDAPTLAAIADPAAIPEDSLQQTVNFAGVGAGGGETQVLTVTATSDNTGLIPNPTVTYTSASATGSLMYTPVANQFGTAIVTVTVMDNGGMLNGGVDTFSRMFTVTVDPVNDPPTALADSFDFVGNTLLLVDEAATGVPEVLASTIVGSTPAADGVLDNDADPVEMSPLQVSGIVGCGDLTAPFGDGPICNTANGGTVVMQSNGQFRFVPSPGDANATDTFQYNVTDGGTPVAALVTLNRFNTIWYVKNDNASGTDNGTSADPFDTLAEAQAVAVAGDTIYVHTGDGTTAGQNAGITLASGQRLLGEGVDLAVTGTLNGVVNPVVFDSAANVDAKIENIVFPGDAVAVDATAGDATGVEIRGVDLDATGGNAVDVTSGGNFNVGVVIEDSIISGASGEGVDINHASSGLATVAVRTTAISAAGNAFDAALSGAGDLHVALEGNTGLTSAAAAGAAVRVDGSGGAGTLYVTSFANNAVLGDSSGDGVVVRSAVFDSDPADADFDLVTGGTLSVGIVADRVPRGVTLGDLSGPVAGNLGFSALSIFSSDGAALRAFGDGASLGGPPPTSGFLLASTSGTADGIMGPAVELDALTSSVQLTNVSSSMSPVAGISLDATSGTFSSTMGGIVTSTGPGLEIIGGSVDVTYSGGIVQSSNAPAVSVSGTHTGTVTLSTGTISATNGTGLQFDDADGNYNFNGTTTLNGGDAGIDILNGSAGTFTFANTSITSPTGMGLNVGSSTAAVTFSGGAGITQANAAAALNVNGHSAGAMNIGVDINATNGTGLQFSGANSTYNINTMTGTTTLNGGDASIDILGGSTGTFTFGNTTITNPTGVGLNINGGTAGVTFNGGGGIAKNNAGASVSITNHTTGTIGIGVDINATGGTGLQFDNADGTYNFNQMTGTTTLGGGDAGIDILNGSTGTFDFGSNVSITTPTGVGINIDTSTGGTVGYDGTITQNGNDSAVRVNAKTGGAVTFSGLITDNAGPDAGINLLGNAGGTITFRGGLALSTGAGVAFSATGGGMVNVCADDNCSAAGGVSVVNTIGAATPLSGTAINIADTILGTDGVTFRSVAVDGAGTSTSAGIVLDDTGAGSFSIAGVGTTNGSGGTLRAMLQDAVRLFNTDGPVSISNMTIEDVGSTASAAPGHHGIDGQQVDGGLTLDNVIIQRVTDSAIHGEAPGGGSTAWNGLTLTDSTLAFSNRFQLAGIADGGGADEAMVTIEGISGTVSITGNDFDHGPGFINLFTAGSGTVDITVQSNTFDDGRKDLPGVPSVGSSGVRVNTNGTIAADIRIGDPAEASNALGNTFTDTGTDASIFIGGFAAGDNADVDLVISRNTITVLDHTSPAGLCPNIVACAFDFPNGGIGVESRGTGTFEAIISHNSLTETQNSGGLNTGSLRVDVSGDETEVIVHDNTLVRSWDATLFIRADDADGNGARGFLEVRNNVYIGGLIGVPASGDDLDANGLANSPAPFLPSRYQVRNGAVLDLTIDNDDMALHDTSLAPNNGFGSHDLLINGDSGGSVSTFNVLIRNSTGPYVTRGFRFRNDDDGIDGTDSSLNLSRGISGAAAASDINSAQAQTVLNDNGNTGNADVQFTGTHIVASTPTLPVVVAPP